MKILIIERKRFSVAAYVHADSKGNDFLPALDELKALGQKYSGSAKGVLSLFKTYAANGRLRPYGVTTEQMHHANYDPDIFEFIKGDVRVFCFLDGDMVILTNTGLKKSQKANPKDVAYAINIRTQYFADKENGNIQRANR